MKNPPNLTFVLDIDNTQLFFSSRAKLWYQLNVIAKESVFLDLYCKGTLCQTNYRAEESVMDWDISPTKAANLTTQLKVPAQFFSFIGLKLFIKFYNLSQRQQIEFFVLFKAIFHFCRADLSQAEHSK